MIRMLSTAIPLLLTLVFVSPVTAADSIKLFNGKDLSGWDYFLVDPKAKKEDVWSVEDGELICRGRPGGYLCTQAKYTNFKLEVEWRWPDKPSNSGVLMRITGKPTMLPNCVEAQLQSGSAGDMYGFQGFKISGDKKRAFANPKVLGGLTGVRKVMGNENKPGEWNKYEITAKGGRITVVLNGKKVNEATGCDVRAGQIGLQSEGGLVRFRNVVLTPLDDSAADAPKQSKPLNVLYVTGGGYHDYVNQEIILREGLSARANITWTTWKGKKTKAGVPELYLNKDWAKPYDVVIHNGCLEDINEQGAEKSVAQIVKEHQDAGLGVVVIHCAMHTYRKDKSGEWEKLTGIHSVRHGPHFPYVVRKLREHPVLAGVPKEWETPKGELYHTKAIKNTIPLAEGVKKDDPKTPRQVNIWVSQHGPIRTFGTTIGHYNDTMKLPVYLDIVARGMLWSAGKLNEDGTAKNGYGPK